ncbi:efflux RND transporter permease subunit [Paenibacillus sp. IHBB 10380]|uniref:efflux RND transporter permease subunit n=1 Tax=Paenibacillus sp. IHBB 10380 TaxID=1566358 RepID=UPI0005CFC0A1|nr:efflux RND transporter permease subunit [Paenibacillus sp. IHBB 10380]AJS58925.1 hypothetical protein UB51_11040 [Paenibacillus sp. IHBB 10380]
MHKGGYILERYTFYHRQVLINPFLLAVQLLMVSLRASSYQADQVKHDLTKPFEEAIRKTNGIVNLETTSYDGGLLMNLYYPMNYKMSKAEQDVRMTLNDAILPDRINQPTVTR